MTNKQELYRKLNALRLEVDGAFIDDIKSTVDEIFKEQEILEKNKLMIFNKWLEERPHSGYFINEFIIDKFLKSKDAQ